MMEQRDEDESLEQVCSRVIDAHFEDHPLVKVPALPQFEKDEDGLLGSLLRGDANIPGEPGNQKVATLLLWDLENQERKNSKVYNYIEKNKDKAPTALYATSGAGKTRSILEFLSHNKGLYFLAEKTERDPGSEDFEVVLEGIEPLKDIRDGFKSAANILKVARRLGLLVYVRYAVHEKVAQIFAEKFQKSVTAYDWLLLQLYPNVFLQGDVFNEAMKACLHFANSDAAERILQCMEPTWCAIFVDEAQKLSKKLKNHFLSESQEHCLRCAFSAVLKGFLSVRRLGKRLPYPVFSGTGFSFDELSVHARSAMAKTSVVEPAEPYFSGFDELDQDRVRAYLEVFLDFAGVGDDVVQHVCKWLRGRPRWAATFLREYLNKECSREKMRTQGTFNDLEAKLVQALDRYLNVMTTKANTNRRHSWIVGEASAFVAIRKFMTAKDHQGGVDMFRAKKSLERAIFHFAVDGKESLIQKEAKTLIELGLAVLSTTLDEDDNFVGVVDEPIVVQAGLNYFNLRKCLDEHMLTQEPGGHGEAFEKVLLPGIQERLGALMESQLKGKRGYDDFKAASFSVPLLTSYGMLAVSCKGEISSTLDWIKSATSARFEGLVAPFCYPDDHFGPDLVFLMWNEDYSEFRPVLSQAKFRREFNQRDALRTLVPAWLYHQNRGDPTKRTYTSQTVFQSRRAEWETELQPKLIRNKRPCIRLMLQYPKEATRSATPGIAHPNEEKSCTDPDSNEQEHDFLVTVSPKEGHQLFGQDTSLVLNHLKKVEK